MCGSFNITQIQGFRISILFRCNTCIVILQGEGFLLAAGYNRKPGPARWLALADGSISAADKLVGTANRGVR